MERRLILGCGYVGSAVARLWLRQGHEVWAVSRSMGRMASLREISGFHPILAEVDSELWHGQVPDTVNCVLNCVSAAGGGLEGYEKSYIRGNQSLLAWSHQSKPSRILYTSSTGVYPFTDGREVREDDAGGDLSDTGERLLRSEAILHDDPKIAGCTTILRLAGIYGPGRHYLLDALRDGQAVFPGNGDAYLNLIYLEDIVSALDLCATHPSAGGQVFNLCDNGSEKKGVLLSWLAKELGLPTPRFDPDATSGRRMRINAAGQMPNRRILNRKIRSLLDWKPNFSTYKEGFRRILNDLGPAG